LFFLGYVGEEVLALSYGSLASGSEERAFLFPSMTKLVAPARLGAAASPVPDGRGGVWWRTESGYYDADGMLLVAAGGEDLFLSPFKDGFAATWRRPGTNEAFLGLYDEDAQLQTVFRVHAESFLAKSELPNGMLAGTVRFGEPYALTADGGSARCKADRPIYPSLLDPETGEVHPILELSACEDGHLGLHALLAREVVRVSAGSECLNVHAEPATSAPTLGCFADGVLLGVREAGPVSGWVAVTTLDGVQEGWVSAEFVER
jgi:hypothetical protein